jgi:hypothetical protein
MSTTPQCSASLLSTKRTQSIASKLARFPVAGAPISSPVFVPLKRTRAQSLSPTSLG